MRRSTKGSGRSRAARICAQCCTCGAPACRPPCPHHPSLPLPRSGIRGPPTFHFSSLASSLPACAGRERVQREQEKGRWMTSSISNPALPKALLAPPCTTHLDNVEPLRGVQVAVGGALQAHSGEQGALRERNAQPPASCCCIQATSVLYSSLACNNPGATLAPHAPAAGTASSRSTKRRCWRGPTRCR